MSEWAQFVPLSPKVNDTDPIVRHDPAIKKKNVAKPNSDTKATNKTLGINNSDADLKKTEGPMIPVIRIANHVIPFQRIKSMLLDYKGFVPEIVITVTQTKISKEEETVEIPSMAADMTVVIIPSVDGAYRPISLNFYIRDIKYAGTEVTYYGTYKLMELDRPQTKQVTFNPAPAAGCSAPYCELGPNKHPTTYELLHVAAVTDCGLGFAASKQVKEISDDRFRFLHHESWFDAIQKHVQFGGKDADSIFDAWIDVYNYLVIVNVPWLFSQDVKAEDLGIHAHIGATVQGAGHGENDDDKETEMIHRIITNFKQMPALSNMTFTNYHYEIDNTSIQDNGVTNSTVIMNPVSVGKGIDGCEQNDTRIEQDSIEGKAHHNEYNYQKFNFAGPEYGNEEDGNTPILNQKVIHDSYFRKLRARRMIIEMNTANFGLQRGTFVTVMIYQYDPEAKKYISDNMNNVAGDKGKKSPEYSAQEQRELDSPAFPLIDPAKSGIYYIDGMTFEYDMSYQKYIQKLYLIKKDTIGEYANSESNIKLKGDDQE